jgi:hypothetical protein
LLVTMPGTDIDRRVSTAGPPLPRRTPGETDLRIFTPEVTAAGRSARGRAGHCRIDPVYRRSRPAGGDSGGSRQRRTGWRHRDGSPARRSDRIDFAVLVSTDHDGWTL